MFLQEFKDHIDTNFPYLYDYKLILACSGGLDSVVLVELCHLLGFNFAIAHCNFKLRGAESDNDEKFVRDLANRLQCQLYHVDFDTNAYANKHRVSIQMAARELRYDWFREIATTLKYDIVFTAHHADDNLETFLINLSRGTGIEGLTGIPVENEMFIRPLLPFSRDQIVKFAKEKGVQWREDSSNSSTKYLRNKIRHKVIPELKSVNDRFLQNFQTTLEYLNESSEFIKNQVIILRRELFEYEQNDVIKISIKKLKEYGNPRIYIYFLLNDYYGFKPWDDIAQIIFAQSGKQIFSDTHRLVKDRDYLLLSPIPEEVSDRTYSIPEEENMIIIPLGMLRFSVKKEMNTADLKTIYVDKKKLKYPLTVRKWQEGDYFYPIGMKGKKKLSKYFKDEKLSLLAKEMVWLLCSGEEIVWIINYRADNRFKITPQTKQILKITIT